MMARYVGVKNGRISVISDRLFSSNIEIIELPPELHDVSTEDLVTHYRISRGQIVGGNRKKPADQLKVALVSDFKMRCGISTYAENLFPEIAKHVQDVKLFIEENQYPTGDIHQLGDQRLSDNQVSVCWKRGESLNRLAHEIKEYDPDIVLINHEWGLFNNARHWLAFLTQVSRYRVITLMHSVFPGHNDKTICEAAMGEIVVHLEAARDCLVNDKQVSGKVHVIPHGCFPCTDRTRFYDMYRSQHTFITQGFLFPYKRFEVSIRAAALLKDKYPDVFFTGLLSESDYNKMGHQVYYDRLTDLVDELGIPDHVSLIRGYQSDATLDAYIRTNRVAVFPYGSEAGHLVFGVSGAARISMSKGIPLITSNVPHFSDLPTIKADTPEQVAEQLDGLFSDAKLISAQIEKQVAFLSENTWEKVGLRFVTVFEE